MSVKTGPLRQLQPPLDASSPGGVPVMIDQPLAPCPSELRIFAARKNDRVLDRDHALVVVTVQGPRLQLTAAQLTLMHEQMKRMLVMVALFAHPSQRRAQFLEREQTSFARFYSVTCHPSSASSHPAARSARYSGPASFSMGLVLLI